MFVAGTNTTSLRMGSEFTAWSPRCVWSNRSRVAVPMHSEVTPYLWEFSSCPMFACEQGCWQGLCVRLLIRLCWGKLNHLESTGCFVSCWNVFAVSGASSHAVLTGFFLLVLFETKLIYKICWTGLFKLFYHCKICVFTACALFGGGKKRCFLKFLFNSCTEII